MRLARHADTPSRRSPDTCSPEPGDKSPGYCHLSLRDAFWDGRRSKSWSVRQIFVVETEPRHEQATARRIVECSRRFRNARDSVEKLGSAEIGSTVQSSRWDGLFSSCFQALRACYDRAVPPGQNHSS